MQDRSAFKINRRALLGGVSATMLAAGLGQGLFTGPASAAPTKGGTLNVLVFPEPTTLVSITTPGGAERQVSSKMTEGLLTYDFDLNPQPELAVEWSKSEDGLRYTFKLREGVKWHDGADFTSADVAFSILLAKEVHPRGRATLANVTEVETPDALTATIVLSQPAPALIYALSAAESPIVPKHVYENTDAATNPASVAPIGTGPYIFKEWARGSHLLLARNPNYWAKDKPYVDEVVMRFLPDAGARAAALESGEADLGHSPVALADIDRLAASPKLVISREGNNYQPQQVQLEFNTQNQYFKDMKVRQAVALSLDRQTIVDVIYYGYAVPAPSPISPLDARFYKADVESYPQDFERAKALLDEAGYKAGANGVRFSVDLDYNPFAAERLQLAHYIRQCMSKIGIEVKIRSQDFAAFVKRVYTDRDFAFTINGLSNLLDPTIGVQRAYWSKNFKVGVPFSNGSAYSNPEVDRLLEAAAVETNDAKRKQLFDEFQDIICKEVPLINLVTKISVTVAQSNVSDFITTGDGMEGSLASVYKS